MTMELYLFFLQADPSPRKAIIVVVAHKCRYNTASITLSILLARYSWLENIVLLMTIEISDTSWRAEISIVFAPFSISSQAFLVFSLPYGNDFPTVMATTDFPNLCRRGAEPKVLALHASAFCVASCGACRP